VSMLRRKLARDLLAMRGQVLTIALVVASATGGFIGSLGTYHALQRARDGFYAEARFGDLFADVSRAPLAALQAVRRIDGVVDAEANVEAASQLVIEGVSDPLIARLVGVPVGTGPRLDRLHLRRGRMIERATRMEALVDEGFAAKRHLAPGMTVTVLMNGRRETLDIVGIGLSPEYINPTQGGVFPDPKGLGVFWVDNERLAGAFDLRGAFNHLAVVLAPSASRPQVLEALGTQLRPFGGRGAYGREDQASHRIVTQEMNQQRVLGTVMPAMFIWVAAFLLNVVLARQIATQREQIASLKALGYRNGAIALHYLGYVAVVVAAGLALGLAVGEWFGRYMTNLYAEFFHFPVVPFQIEAGLALVAGGVTAAAAAAGALLAIRNVVRLSPAQAMHAPSPPRYRRLLLERTRAAAWLPLATRMILRNVERRPLRSLLCVAGVAASIALIISGTFWWDAINVMIDREFNRAERGDATLAFVQPRAGAVQFEVRRLPGVTDAEPFRSVPVQLRSAQHAYRTAILGLPPGARLRRVLDAGDRPVALPPDGLMLSQGLAERLALRAGDTVQVEALEGRRTRRDLRLEGTIDDQLGLAAYMDQRALNRLMSEGDAASGMNLRLDSGARAALLARVRATPAIATLVIKQDSLATFREISARNVLVFSTVFTVFAATIAVGVVYNNARIALAERSWELASLRVLGFSRREVSGFLLGELALEVALAIPLGLLAGIGLAHYLTGAMQGDNIRIPVIIAARTYLLAIGAVLAAGVFSAMIVRRRIDALDMVGALKARE
jgi:putative ABC transport system permease protein